MKLKIRDYLFLRFLSAAPRNNEEIRGFKKIAPALIENGLIAEDHRRHGGANGSVLSISEAGKRVLSERKEDNSMEKAEKVFLNITNAGKNKTNLRKILTRNEIKEKSEEFLLLFQQGVSYEKIGNLSGISKARVIQILRVNPEYEPYRKERSKALAEARGERSKKKAEASELKRLNKSKERMEKAELFLSLYKQGMSQMEIGKLHNITRARLNRIFRTPPVYESYLEEREKKLARRKFEKETAAQSKVLKKSLAHRFPEHIDRFWDREKNGDLDPAQVRARTSRIEIWLKCPEGHSWKRKPGQVISNWKLNKKSGCPLCAGRINKPQKQNKLAEAYNAHIDKYWDLTKNNELSLDPNILTLGSNRRAWFKCPVDAHNWSAPIFVIVKKWSRGDSGCAVCNKSISGRKSLTDVYPEYVEKYWNRSKNNELSLDPGLLTLRSSYRAWFRCPSDGYQWFGTIYGTVRKWSKGNPGCRTCKKNAGRQSLPASIAVCS